MWIFLYTLGSVRNDMTLTKLSLTLCWAGTNSVGVVWGCGTLYFPKPAQDASSHPLSVVLTIVPLRDEVDVPPTEPEEAGATPCDFRS